MLTHLQIRDFAIIDAVELELRPGLTVLTGETGAGKSILVDALQLLAGGADVVQLRDKTATGAEVLSAAAWAAERCAAHGALFVVNDRPDLAVVLDQAADFASGPFRAVDVGIGNAVAHRLKDFIPRAGIASF